MKRMIELGSLALGAILMVSFAGCDDSSSDNDNTGGGTGVVPGQGGGTLVAAGGGTGLATGQGGAAPGQGGGTGTTVGAPCGTNVLSTPLGDQGNWVGGDPTSTEDNVCGVQGALYAYGDGTSCTLPANNNPCSGGVCTISGNTIVDSTFAAWGCGIGLSLNDSGGSPSVKRPYVGNANGFRVTIEGNYAQELRISYTSGADTEGMISPFAGGSAQASTIAGPGTYTVLFSDVSCPPSNWGTCNPLAGMPYDIQFQICGGSTAGSYTLSITDITPISS